MNTLQRELRVAFSPRAQPVWFRLIKWAVIIFMIVRYRQRPWFGYAVGVTLVGAVSLHLFYRWKTQGWRRPWGGWSDVVVNA
jgi:hypothetical protein